MPAEIRFKNQGNIFLLKEIIVIKKPPLYPCELEKLKASFDSKIWARCVIWMI